VRIGLHAMLPSGVSGAALAPLPFLEFPPDLQRHILSSNPLQQGAQLACLNKELRAGYMDRVKQRDAAVASLLESHPTPEFRQGLSCAQTAFPRDLIINPPVRPLALCLLLGIPIGSNNVKHVNVAWPHCAKLMRSPKCSMFTPLGNTTSLYGMFIHHQHSPSSQGPLEQVRAGLIGCIYTP
jgi:hypothetical protein